MLAGAWQMARVELTELRSSPGLYLFAPLILLETLGPARSPWASLTRRS